MCNVYDTWSSVRPSHLYEGGVDVGVQGPGGQWRQDNPVDVVGHDVVQPVLLLVLVAAAHGEGLPLLENLAQPLPGYISVSLYSVGTCIKLATFQLPSQKANKRHSSNLRGGAFMNSLQFHKLPK